MSAPLIHTRVDHRDGDLGAGEFPRVLAAVRQPLPGRLGIDDAGHGGGQRAVGLAVAWPLRKRVGSEWSTCSESRWLHLPIAAVHKHVNF